MKKKDTAIQKPTRGNVVEHVIQYIREGMIQGAFAPGQRLITSELMAEIGVSRGSIREAFSRMASEGLLDLVPNRGAAIRRLSRVELVNLFRIRASLEGLAARLAAEAIEHNDNLVKFQDAWNKCNKWSLNISASDFTQINSLFHTTLVTLAKNPQLADLLERLQLRVFMQQLGRALSDEDIIMSLQEHIPIAEAILAADPDSADQAMRTHLHNSCGRILLRSKSLLKPEHV